MFELIFKFYLEEIQDFIITIKTKAFTIYNLLKLLNDLQNPNVLSNITPYAHHDSGGEPTEWSISGGSKNGLGFGWCKRWTLSGRARC